MVVVFPTALDSFYGDSIALGAIAADYQATWGTRVIDAGPTTAGKSVILPPANGATTAVTTYDKRVIRAGGPMFLVLNSGTQNLAVKDFGGTTLTTLVPGAAVRIWKVTGVTTAGVWFTEPIATVNRGTALATNRQTFAITIGISDTAAYNLHDDLLGAYHWDGTTAVAVTLTIASGVVRGSSSTSLPAIDTGTLPAGSTCILINQGTISGKGGDGGRGGMYGISALGVAGGVGGPALRMYQDMTVINLGTIAGGGGGGGGGGAAATTPGQHGGGGGGGQGHGPSTGGAGYGGSVPGSNGTVNINGPGGAASGSSAGPGGAGGTWGTAGTAGTNATASGGSGGAAGPYLLRKTTATVTWLVTGTRLTSEVTF
jgi:hypothetical protein